MNISLTAELEKLVNEKVKGGLYHTASEVVRDALRLLEERDRLYSVRLQDLRQEVQKGLDQLDRGEGTAFDPGAFKRRLRQAAGKRKRRPAA
jgi:antitoxin ParD1/3/4